MKRIRENAVFSGIFTLCFAFCFMGKQLADTGNILWTGSYVIKLIGISLVCGVVFGVLLAWCLPKVEKLFVSIFPARDGVAKSSGRVFGLSWGLLVLAWLPGYLAYYPGICAYDFTIQSGQFISHEYNDHHPLAHTLLMEGFYNIGGLFGDVNTGMALYVLFQLLCLAAAIAMGVTVLHHMGKRRILIVLVQLYGMLCPFNWYMSVSATKDTLFTASVLIMLWCMLVILWKNEDCLKPDGWDIGYVAATVAAILFRNNGKFAMIVVFGFLFPTVFFGKKYKRLFVRLLTESIFATCVGCLIIALLFNVTGATSGDKREMLSMPIQQLARTMLYHGGVGAYPEDDNTMSEVDKALINDFLPGEAYRDYRPDISDPVKKKTNTSVFRYRPVEFLKTYLGLLVQYPGDYINAALGTNAGFLYPFDTSHGDINFNGRDEGLGYIQTRWAEAELNPRGIYKDSKWESLHERLEAFANVNGYLDIPLLKYILMPGFYLWFYLLYAGYQFCKKQYRNLLPLAFVLGYYGTLILGPTVQLRYIYPMMVALPFLMIGSVKKANDV